MSTGAEEWINTAVPAGSGRYYALLHSDEKIQKQQQLIATLVSVFSKLCFQSREIEVAKHKLEWWRQELEKEQFNHPVMVEISKTTLSVTTKERLKHLLNGYATLLESGSPSTNEQNHQFHVSTGATACQLLCFTENEEDAVANTGIALSKLRCYRYLRQHVDSGLLCLPMSSLDSAGISPALLTPTAADDNVKTFLADGLKHLHTDLQQCKKGLEDHLKEVQEAKRTNYKSLYIYLTLQSQLLQVMCKDELSVVEQVSRLTPIRNYWYAFRAARRFDKKIA